MPEPTKARLTVANIAVMLPIELLVHALVVETHLPYVAKVLVLTLTATVLVIWVAEPSAARILRGWLHAPALRHRRKLGKAPSLWRARTVLQDEPGSLQKITRALARLDTNILSIHVHPVAGGVLDEFVLSAPGNLSERQLLEALHDGGGTRCACMAHHRAGHGRRPDQGAEPGGQDRRRTGRAATCGGRTAARPDPARPAEAVLEKPDAGTRLKVPTAWHGPLTFVRPGEPFTPAESARAHRLAELAEILAHRPAAGSKR